MLVFLPNMKFFSVKSILKYTKCKCVVHCIRLNGKYDSIHCLLNDLKNISWNQVIVELFIKNVVFTKFLFKTAMQKFHNLHTVLSSHSIPVWKRHVHTYLLSHSNFRNNSWSQFTPITYKWNSWFHGIFARVKI